jgi:DNA polymerase III alpha subunit
VSGSPYNENIVANLENRYIDITGNCIFKKEYIIEKFYENGDLKNFIFENCEDVEKYNSEIDKNIGDNKLKLKTEKDIDYEENIINLLHRSKTWFIPEEYKKIDINEWFNSKKLNEVEKKRVKEELKLFKKHNMYDLLRFLIYMMDIVKEKKLIIGVGRGSSVSCFCLYLIGVHRINSIEYDLDYNDFFKENI